MNGKTGLKLINAILFTYLAKNETKLDIMRKSGNTSQYIAMNRFTRVFKKTPSVIGMIHVKPLPGKFLRII